MDGLSLRGRARLAYEKRVREQEAKRQADRRFAEECLYQMLCALTGEKLDRPAFEWLDLYGWEGDPLCMESRPTCEVEDLIFGTVRHTYNTSLGKSAATLHLLHYSEKSQRWYASEPVNDLNELHCAIEQMEAYFNQKQDAEAA
jgi:hypothetical protein